MSETRSAGTMSVAVKPDTKGFGTELKSSLMGHTRGIGEGMGGLIKEGLKSMAGPIAAVTAAFSVEHLLEDSVGAFKDYMGQVASTQRLIGGSVQDVSSLTGAFKMMGMTLGASSSGEDGLNVTGALQKFSVNLGKAAGDSKKTATMNALLGTSFKDAHGNILPMSDLLPKVADRFASMPDGAQKTALAVQLFGRAGAQMIPMLDKGSAGMKELEDKAKSAGLVVDNMSLNIFKEAKKSTREFQVSIQGLKVSLGQDLLPVIEGSENVIRGVLGPAMNEMAKWLAAHRDSFVKFGAAVEEFGKKFLSSVGTVLKPFGEALKELGPTFASLAPQVMTLMSALSPMHLVFEALKPVLPSIISTLAELAQTIGGTLGSVLKQILPPITDVVKTLTVALSGIMVQLMPAITELVSVLGGALGEVVKMLAPVIVTLVKAFAALLPPILPLISQIINLAISAIMPLARALTPLLKELLPPIIDLFMALMPVIQPLARFLEGVLVVAIQVLVNVLKFLIPVIDSVIIGLVKFVAGIVETAAKVETFFYGLAAKILGWVGNAGKWLVNVGKNIIEGLVNGVKSAMGLVSDVVSNVADTVVGGFKKLLGIHSPSTVFHEFGKNILEGLNNGLVGSSSDVQATMQKVSDWLISAFDSKKISSAQRAAGLAAVQAFSGPLLNYQTQYQSILKKLDDATSDLTNKIQERANYVSGLASKFGATLDIVTKTVDPQAVAEAQNNVTLAQEKYNTALQDTKLTAAEVEKAHLALLDAQNKLNDAQSTSTTAKDAIQQLKDKLNNTIELKKVTDQLLQMGLDKSLYKQVVEAGSVDFAKSIVEGGTEAVKQLNVLGSEADKAALDLANGVGDTLYGQGIKFAQSVVDGLTKQKSDLETLMQGVADKFASTISAVVENNTKTINGLLGGVDNAITRLQNAQTAAQNASTQKTVNTATSGLKTTTVGGTAVADRVAATSTTTASQVINYYAAPNDSISAEQKLTDAVQRARVLGWT